MRPKALATLALIPFLAACGAVSGGKVGSVGTNASKLPSSSHNVRAPSRYKVRAPQVQRLPGLEGVIGATPADLARQFGPARLDVWEGDARKLQFSGNACVLDVYLYPSELGRDPQATYVDARNPADGRDVDRPACIAALRQAKR